MRNLRRLGRLLPRIRPGRRLASTGQPPDDKDEREKTRSIDEVAAPTTCCMSGCANCVWIEYAEKLSEALKGSQSDVQKRIMDEVRDPNMRAFLSMELRARKIIE